MRDRWYLFALSLLILTTTLLLSSGTANATTFEVGEGRAYANIGNVPWESLQPGDTVLIHWRAAAYKEKWVICRQGQPSAPITVRGVPGPNGELPVIDGNGANTRPALRYWNEARGVIKIGGASVPADTTPQYIVVENLDVRGARPPYIFTATDGSVATYADNAAAFYIEKGDHVTVRNCVISDSGNGLFASSSDTVITRDLLIEGCYFHDNGIENSMYQHNVYTEALGITFQYNRLGPLRAGCLGNNLKDRSAGLVVRYNWIEGANRELDLVDGGGCPQIVADPRYRETFVYGNVLVEPDADGSRQIVHYGGDSANAADYRKGTLYFYHNTVVSKRTDRTTLLRLSTGEERCEARNNIIYTVAGGDTLSLLDNTGTLALSHNWLKPGFVSSFSQPFAGVVADDSTSKLATSPGFVDAAGQDYRLAADSMCADAGGALSPAALAANNVTRQYVRHQSSEERPNDGAPDLGAFERATAAPTPQQVAVSTASLPAGAVGILYSGSLTASGGVAPYLWAIAAGSLPAGLTLDSKTGVISGTPTSAGTTSFTVQVSDTQSPAATASKPLTITINPASLQITTTSLPGARLYLVYSQTLSATGGGGPYTWSVVSGSLPTGLTLNAASGAIAGTPKKRGTWSFTVRVQDAQKTPSAATRTYTLTVR